MSWSIGLILDTIVLPDACEEELNALMDERGMDHVAYDNELEFNADHMEHMDFLDGDQEVIDILLKHEVEGVVRFASVEGDNSGDMWEHRFKDGEYSQVAIALADVVIDHDSEG